MQIEILRPGAMPIDMVEHWRALQAADGGLDSPFLSPDWALAVDRAWCGRESGVRVAVLREGGRARGYLSVRARAFTAMAVGAPLCDYQGVVAEPGVVLDPRALVRALGVGRFDFSHMLTDQTAFAPYGHGRATSWIVDVKEGYATYAASRRQSSAALKTLDKKRRKVERERGSVVFTAHSRSWADFEQLFAWKRVQLRATSQVDIFAPGWSGRLIRDLFEAGEAAPGSGGILFTLHIGGALAASHFHLRGGRTLHAWMIAHCDDFEHYSPGLLLFQEILRWMEGAPFDRLDLGLGDYRFKRELANARRDVAYGFVGIASPAAFVRGAAYGVRKAAEALPLGAVSDLPGKAMRRMDILRGLR